MSAYTLHRDGDCWPDTCRLCAQEDDTDDTDEEDE